MLAIRPAATLIGGIGTRHFRIDIGVVIGVQFRLNGVGTVGDGHLLAALTLLLRQPAFFSTEATVRADRWDPAFCCTTCQGNGQQQ